jgi:MoxR-like ATPase
LLYTQLLRDKLQETLSDAVAFPLRPTGWRARRTSSSRCASCLQRPLLKAILSEKPTVLLIDEIDRADAEFEAFLLEV